MTVSTIRDALTGLLRAQFPQAKVMQPDEAKPVVRASFQIDVLPASGGMACAGAREWEADIDLWYYPTERGHPWDECNVVGEALAGLLAEGFEAGGVWLHLDDGLDIDASDGVLAVQFAVAWSESAAETGELLETLIWNKEESV